MRIGGEELVVLVLKGMGVYVIIGVKGRGGGRNGVDRVVLKKGESGWSRGFVEG